MDKMISKLKISDGKDFSLKNFDAGYADGFNKSDAKAVLDDLIEQTFDLQTAVRS